MCVARRLAVHDTVRTEVNKSRDQNQNTATVRSMLVGCYLPPSSLCIFVSNLRAARLNGKRRTIRSILCAIVFTRKKTALPFVDLLKWCPIPPWQLIQYACARGVKVELDAAGC